MEKAILQNLYQDKMLLYRNYRVADVNPISKYTRGEAAEAAETKTGGPEDGDGSAAAAKHALVHLWDFICDETRGRDVTCVAWNRLAPDVLAVGYGPAEANGRRARRRRGARERADGLVAFWSLKNPEHPEWHFATPFGVTALDFSPTQHNLLAVGLHDGTVSVYDARVPGTNAPFLRSGGGVPGKHSDPVWQVSWARGGGDSGDKDASALVSISTDGRVTQWRLEKGLEHVDLMRLTRVARRGLAHSAAKAAAKPPEATISPRRRHAIRLLARRPDDVRRRHGGGRAAQVLQRVQRAVPAHVPRAQRAGAPRGLVAVRARRSPSASADWTTKLWFDAEENAALTLQSGRGVDVTDVAWSPSDATVLATSSLDGGLDVWDLAISTLRPAVSADRPPRSLACVARLRDRRR